MNKHCYRVVFNKARSMMMVVSEAAKSNSKTAGDGSRNNVSNTKTTSNNPGSLSRLMVAILCCQSMIYTQVQAATSAIQNTASNIPIDQRAALLKAPNGTPIVNIRTPNSNGLSHNTYNQFDIGSNGAVLNNSMGGASTQLAGAIAGNQYLGKNVANTILNEVRSNAPVKFQGNLEVAGQRADVIIASPSGLQIQGGGFINANRATLTTGTPKIDSAGNLTGFDVKQGQVQFDNAATGSALGGVLYDTKNKNQANYVDVLARAIVINGQIHATQDVDMVIGSNTVDYETGAATKITGTGIAPTLAVDVSALGGIYANSINLIGNESGLGVRNAGNIKATQQVVLTNSGKIQNTGAIETTKAQTSLVSVNATGTTGSIEHSGTISSYGMIDIQADKDITLDAGIIKKNNAGTAIQLMPDIIRVDAGGSLKVSNGSDVRNLKTDDKTNIYTHSTLDTTVDSKSIIASNGGISIDADRYAKLIDTSSLSAGVGALNISSKSGTTVDNATVTGRGDIYINSKTADTVISNNSQLSAQKSLAIGAGRDATLKSGSKIVAASDLTIAATRNATVDNAGSIKVTNDATVTAGELAYLKDSIQPITIGKQLTIEGKQATVLNSTANANNGIYITSQGKATTITNSTLNSDKGSVTAIANQAALNVNKLTTNANSTILTAGQNLGVFDSKIKTNAALISSGQDMTIERSTINVKDAQNSGNVLLYSDAKINLSNDNIEGGRDVKVNSKSNLTIIDTNLTAKNNLALNSDWQIFSNSKADIDSKGQAFTNYEVNKGVNKFEAGDILTVSSKQWQILDNSEFKGSAVFVEAGSDKYDTGIYLNDNVKFDATGLSSNVKSEINGNIQLASKKDIYIDDRHKIIAKEDFTVVTDGSISLVNATGVVAKGIQFQTLKANTLKDANNIYNTSGDGDINIYGTNLTTTSTTQDSLVMNAANHLNIVNSQTKALGTTTLKSGNLLRVNNSTLDSDKNLIIDSGNQLIFNGDRAANSNTGLTHTVGSTTLKAGEILSINSKVTQSYQDVNVTGGAVLINSANSIGFNTNTSINAIGSTKLAANKEKLIDGKGVNTLNGDLAISSGIGNLTIDPKNITLNSTGDLSLAARGGKLHLKGDAGTQGLGSEQIIKLSTAGDINLSGKSVLIEGSDLDSIEAYTYERRDFLGRNRTYTRYRPSGEINVTATDGSVEVKGVKNSFTNYVSPQKIIVIEQQIVAVDNELGEYGSDLEAWNNYNILWKAIEDANGIKNWGKAINNFENFKKTPEFIKAIPNIASIDQLNQTKTDLERILATSQKESTGFEHKASSIVAGKDINITAKQGVLIEGADISSSLGGINILAEGNLAATTIIGTDPATNLSKTNINNDSIRITGLADIYQQGNISNGNVTGPNYSYHQLINQPKLTAKGDIKISAQGKLAKATDAYNSVSKIYTTNNAVILNSADIFSANGNVRIDAALGDINLESAQAAFMDGSQSTDTSKKWYGKKKTTTTTKTSNNSNAVTTDIKANNISLTADNNINIYGSELLAAPTGSIKLTAGKLLNLYAIDNVNESSTDVQKRSSFLGVRYNKDHTNDTRQELSQLPAKLIGGQAYTASGGSTLLQGTIFNTLKPADIKVGVGEYADNAATVILAPITNQITTTHNQERESTVWMKTVDQGSVVTTAALPKFNQVPTITSPNSVVVAVPVEVTVDANNKAKTDIQKSSAELGKLALELSKQPGYEYLATLDKTNDINWVQVDLIQKNWDYTQEGLTPGAAALIAIAVTIATSGVGGAAGMGATLTGTTGAMGAASTAAFSSLAAQASVTLINNKGDINKTLKDLASSATIRSMATAALTAGVGARLGLGSSVTDSFGQKLANGVSTSLTQAVADATINGVSFEEALKNSLLSSLVDVFAASAFTNLVKPIDTDEFVRNLAHKLVAASVGCVAASAKQQSCDAGALGAMVGEMLGDYLVDGSPLTPKQESDILNAAKLLAGSVALLTNVDVNTAASSASLAVENNALHPGDFVKVARDFENQCLKSTNAAQCSSALNKWKQTSYDRAGLKSSEAIQGWEDFAYSEYQPAIAICKTDRNCLAFVTSKLVTDSINFAGSSVDLIEVAHIAKLSAAKIMKDSGAFFVAGLDDFGWMIGSGVVTVPSRFTAPLISLYAQSGKVVLAPLSKVPSILDPAKFRSGMPSSWFKASYNPATKAVSISVAEIKTASGQVERVMSVSGNAWHGVNAPKSPITLNGINYKIIKDIPQNLAGTANHAEKNIFEYINTAYANQRVTVKLGVENTNSRAPGMCGGCGTAVRDLSRNNKNLNITIYQGSTLVRNP